MSQRNLLILGANGFIGSHLCAYILKNRDWNVYAMDIRTGKLAECLTHPRFHFTEGDITIHKEWVEYHVKKCDTVLPLVAIASPSIYVKNPLSVFELDFEANLEVVRHCVTYKKRLVFPSTSEVYGMSEDIPYDEETSRLVTGPINKPRWIYASSKQLMDRIIYAYGQQHGLNFTLFRPFNWFGPKLDNVWTKDAANRVVAQFLHNLFHRENIVLVNGGLQKRCFLYIDDAIDALMRILENNNGKAANRIFNIGHPGNLYSIADLADLMLDVMSEFSGYEDIRSQIKVTSSQGSDYYGKGYEDVEVRIPCIEKAKQYLGWQPSTDLRGAMKKTIAYYHAQMPKALVKA